MRRAVIWTALVMAIWLSPAFSAEADWAQIADGATTIVGLEQPNISEANGVFCFLIGWEILGVKLVVTQAVKFTPKEFCQPGLVALTVTGYAAGFWNIAIISGGAGWYGLPVAIGITVWRWRAWVDDAVSTCANPWGRFAPTPIAAPAPGFDGAFNGR